MIELALDLAGCLLLVGAFFYMLSGDDEGGGL